VSDIARLHHLHNLTFFNGQMNLGESLADGRIAVTAEFQEGSD
jgi:hypothetical protein